MSYATTAELTDYATARGITLTGDLTVLLTKAHDFIEAQTYQGSRYISTQSTMWPRSDVWIDGVLIDPDVVPQGIKNAEMQVAIEIFNGDDPLNNVDRAVKSEQVGDLKVEYMDNAANSKILRKIWSLLMPYMSATGRVQRG